MQEWTPILNRLFVFTVPEQEKFAGSVFYRTKTNDGYLSQCQPVWVLIPSRNCKEEWKRGQKCYIHDGFELDPTDLDLWPRYENEPEFKGLKEFVESVGGKVLTSVVAEGSILATEDN